MQDREYSRVGPSPSQMLSQVDAVQLFAQELRRQPPHPFVEIAQHELRSAHALIRDDGRQTPRLMPALQDRRAQVDVVQMQRAAVHGYVDALHATRLARLPR